MPREGQILGDFELVREIGRGAVGAVWEARQRSLDRSVAIKFLSDAPRGDVTWTQRFEAEAAQVARLSHPAILPVHALGHDGDTMWFAMELVRGRDLQEVLRDEGRIAPPRAAEIARDVARALDHAHDAGLVHRDVKPANIMVRDDGRVALTDFGLSKKLGSGALTTTGMLVGTPYYMSPEQVAGEREGVGPPSDIYGLGVTLYEMLTGQAPLKADNALALIRKITDETPAAPTEVVPDLPPALSALTMACLAKDPANRPASASALAASLEAFLRGESSSTPTGSSVAPAATSTGGAAAAPPAPRKAGPSNAARWKNLLLSGALIAAGIWLFKFSDRFGAENAQDQGTQVEDTDNTSSIRTSEADRVEVASLAWSLIRNVITGSPRSSGPPAKFVERWRSDVPARMQVRVDPPEARVEAFVVPTTRGYATLEDPAGGLERAPGIYRIRCIHPGRVDTIASVILPPGASGTVEITMPQTTPETTGFVFMAGVWGTSPEGEASTLRSMHDHLGPHYMSLDVVARDAYDTWVRAAPSEAERERRAAPRPRRGGGPATRRFLVSSEMAAAYAQSVGARLPRPEEFAHLHWVTRMATWMHEFQDVPLDEAVRASALREGMASSWRFSVWLQDRRKGGIEASPTVQGPEGRRSRMRIPDGAPRQLALARDL